MSPEEIQRRLAIAEHDGYSFETRHQPAADLEEPDWIVVVRAPDGRTIFPGAVDSEEIDARRRAILTADRDRAARVDT